MIVVNASASLAEVRNGQPASGIEDSLREPEWNFATRLAFRFLFAYLLLYNLPGPRPAETWLAVHVFHLTGSVTTRHPTGSGDTALDYSDIFFTVSLSLAVLLIWSVFDRKRRHYRTLYGWLYLLVRFALSLTLFGYGLAKIFPVQMPFPSLARLIRPYGNFSPMGVLWAFMGTSPAYEMFSGLAEVLGGALLLFRRTTLLGAMLSAGVMLNVVALNFCYDVPVKLYSLHLLFMALFLGAPNIDKLACFLVFNRPSMPPSTYGPILKTRREKIGGWVVKICLVGPFLAFSVAGNNGRYQTVANPSRPALYGLYEVESFVKDGQDPPSLSAEPTRWHRLIIEWQGQLTAQLMDATEQYFEAEYPPAGNSLTILQPGDRSKKYMLSASRPDSEHLVLTGTLFGDSVSIRAKKLDPARFLLLNRGFHWIQEDPFNR